MNDSRKNIKCSPQTFETGTTLKTELGYDWDTLLDHAFTALQAQHTNTDDSTITNEDLARELDTLRTTLPAETASAVEQRFR